MKKQILTIASIFIGLAVYGQNGNGNGNTNNGNGTNSFPTNGNVGIGNTNPTEKLRVNGNVKVDSTMIVAKDATFESSARVDEDLRVNGQLYVPNMLEVNQVYDSELTFIDQTGAIYRGNESSTRDYIINTLYNDQRGCSSQYLALPTWKSGQNKIYSPCPEVNVGIGTSDPQHKLDVRGVGYFSGGVRLGTAFNPNPSAYIEGHYILGSNKPWIRFTTLDGTQNKTAFLVNNDGGLYCTSVRVRLRDDIPVPDYVFSSNYSLMPLKEVEKFIKTNSHLPNVPSEKQIREEGLAIEDMQLKLLEKVEELTLYIIKLNSENERMQAEINDLKTSRYE